MNFSLGSDAGRLEWLLAFGALAAFAALWPLARRLPRPLLSLRAIAALILVFLLTKPAVDLLEGRAARPRLAVLIDTGPSMAALDEAQDSRLERVVRWLKSNRRTIERQAEVALFAASGQARHIGWEDLDGLKPSQAALDLGSALSDASGSGPASRFWLISDGTFDAGLANGLELRVPVDAMGVGDFKAKASVSIAEIGAPDFVFLHSRFPVSAAFEASELSGGILQARLMQGNSRLAELEFPVRKGFEVFRATFSVEARALGSQAYRLEVAASLGSSRVRAGREFAIEVIRQKYRIMYLAGRPSFEYSHLRAQLKADPNHELVSFVILRNPENVSPVPDSELSLIPFPAAEIFVQSLVQFDLFILENFAYWRFNLPSGYLENLKRFVVEGGALLVIGGSNAFTKGGYQGTPLEDALPVTLLSQAEDFTPGLYRPEPMAMEHPLISLGEPAEVAAQAWRNLPSLDGFTRFASVRPGATVLIKHPSEKAASGQDLPIVAVREYGRGKVMLIGTDSTWRWKLEGGRNWKISSFYGRFWSRAVQYLTGSLDLKKVKFSPLPDRLPAREPAVLSLHVFDEHFRPLPGAELDLRVTWTNPGGRTLTVSPFEREPGVFQLELTGLSEGRHSVRAVARYRGQLWGEDESVFRWEGLKGQAPLNRKALGLIAERSGGRYADLGQADLDEWLKALPPVRHERAAFSRRPLWASTFWLWLLSGLLAFEWFLRRRLGFI